MIFKNISGGVCAAKGFVATGIHSGLRKERKDLALIYSQTPCVSAGVFTQNLVKADPVVLSQKNIKNNAQAIICNSGNANACTSNGMQVAKKMADLAGNVLNLPPEKVIVASTGVIGQKLDTSPIENNILLLADSLNENGSTDCVEAIMTTDLATKEIAVAVDIEDKTYVVGGIAKGSGMIEPNMATMLGFITTDLAISEELLQSALSQAVDSTFNMVSVDGDTSTNDMVALLSNSLAENRKITSKDENYEIFVQALEEVCKFLAKAIAADGEGATKLLECSVTGAESYTDAQKLAKSVINSSLFKAAMFGEDANWGRVLAALGYAEVPLNVSNIDVSFISNAGSLEVCKAGQGLDFDETFAKKVLAEKEIIIAIKVGQTSHSAIAWGCDLSYDYVKINGDYRS